MVTIITIIIGLTLVYLIQKVMGVISLFKSDNKTIEEIFEFLRSNGKIIYGITWFLLIIVLFIHVIAYWTNEFEGTALGFISMADFHGGDGIEFILYGIELVILIFVMFTPYAWYTKKVMKYFKVKAKQKLFLEYGLNYEVKDKIKFPDLNKIIVKNDLFRSEYIINSEEKFDGRYQRYFAEISHGDIFYIPNKDMHVVETNIMATAERYRKTSDSSRWVSQVHEQVFSGFLIAIKKNEVKDNFKTKYYQIKNEKVWVKSDDTRIEIKPSYIELYFDYKINLNLDSFVINDVNLECAFESKKEINYEDINPRLAKKIEELNVNMVMETSEYIYVFHEEEDIDFFTYYSKLQTKESLKVFKQDLELLIDIVNVFDDK